MSNDNLNDLKNRVKNASTLEEAYAVFFQMLEEDASDEEIKEVAEQMHFSEEAKKQMQEEEENILKK